VPHPASIPPEDGTCLLDLLPREVRLLRAQSPAMLLPVWCAPPPRLNGCLSSPCSLWGQILLYILQDVGEETLAADCPLVSQQFNDLAHDEQLWKHRFLVDIGRQPPNFQPPSKYRCRPDLLWPTLELNRSLTFAPCGTVTPSGTGSR
jgi:hypothetical protein